MMEMTAQWRAWAQRVAALSLRERVLILLTGTILLGAAGIYGWLDAADTRLSQERQALTAAQRDLEILGKFNGRNHHALAVEYDMTENAIYKLLKRTQDRKFDRDQHKIDFGDGL